MTTKTFPILILFLILILPSSLFAQVPAFVPTNGLVGYWPFNGNANDESGNGNNGTVNGATLTTDRNGNANSAYSFDGLNNQIDANNTSNITIASNSANTISIWFNSNGNNFGRLLSFTSGMPGDLSYRIQLVHEVNGNITFNGAQFTGLPNPPYVQVTCPNIMLNSWNNIIVTQENSLVKIFFNSELIESNHYSGPTSPNGLNMNLHLGYIPNEPLERFSGIIDDIAIYNRALTQEEITMLYNGTTNNGGGNNNDNAANTTVPAGISYQAVARNAQGMALVNTAVQVKFTLITDSLSGSTEYVETHSLNTNCLGLFATAFGTGTAVTGTWAGINWTHSNKYLKVEMDAGNGFVDLGTQQLLSSPFAIRAQSAATIENGALPVYSDNAAAIAGGLTVGKLYRTATGDLKVVY